MPLLRAEAGSRPAGEVLFFASPKKSTQKKGDPAVCVPCADATGQPAVLGFGGVSLELAPFHFAQTIASPHPPNPALLGASRGARGAEQPHGPLLRSAQLAQRVALAPAIRCRAQRWPVWMFCSPCPCGCAEERRVWRIRARVCLSDAQRRELSETPPHPSTAGCPVAKRRGRRQWGRLSFGYFSLAKQRKVPRLPGDSRPPPSTQAQRPIHPKGPTTPAQPRIPGCKLLLKA